MQITIDAVKEDGVKKFYVMCEYASSYEIFYDVKDVLDYVNYWL